MRSHASPTLLHALSPFNGASGLLLLLLPQVMLGMEGVWDIHDLHIWAISTSMKPVLTAHVHIGPDADANVVLQQLEAYVRGLGIDHSTIQICNIAAPPQLDQPAQQAEV